MQKAVKSVNLSWDVGFKKPRHILLELKLKKIPLCHKKISSNCFVLVGKKFLLVGKTCSLKSQLIENQILYKGPNLLSQFYSSS